MTELQLQLKELLGAREYNRFSKEVLVPTLVDLVEKGKLTDAEYDKIARHVEENGPGILDVWASDAQEIETKHSQGGGIIVARKKLTPDAELKLLIKQFADKASFKRGVKIQDRLTRHLAKTSLAGTIPTQSYSNNAKRIVVMPFLEGETLGTAGVGALKQTLETYVNVVSEVEKANLFAGKIPALTEFNDFFKRYYAPNDELAKLYAKEVAPILNEKKDEFLHGDLHPRNVLVNGKVHLIDWELAMMGFMEFDLYKLFTKLRVPYNDQKKWVESARRQKEGECSSSDLEDKLAGSWKRHVLNTITQDLLTVQRYKMRSVVQKSDRLERMARTAYNIAIRNIARARDEGFVSDEFVVAVEEDAMRKGQWTVSDVKFDEWMLEYNPHNEQSQENLVSRTLEDDLKGLPPNPTRRQKNRKILERSLRKRDWKRIALVGTLLGALAFAGGVGVKYERSELEREDAKRQELQRGTEYIYASNFREGYQLLIEGKMNGGLRKYGAAGTGERKKATPLKIESELVAQVCEKYNLDLIMIKRMLQANALFAGMSQFGESGKDINLLDPIRISYSEWYDPGVNLENGAKRLSDLFDKYNVSRERLRYLIRDGTHADYYEPTDGGIRRALVEFYGFEKPGQYRSLNWEEQRKDGAFSLSAEVYNLAWAAINGLDFEWRFNLYSFKSVPDSFKQP